jgi:hypothetical protein
MSGPAKDDVYIGHRKSAPSLASDIIAQKRQCSDAHKDDYSLSYLFIKYRNMAKGLPHRERQPST